MRSFLRSLAELLKSNLSHVIYIATIVVLLVMLFRSCSTNRRLSEEARNNIVALTDSIKTYKSKTGDLVAAKTLLEGKISDLELANKKLYDQTMSMKIKEPDLVASIKGTIDNGVKDVVWIHDNTCKDTLEQSFSFINDYRELTGTIWKKDSNLGLNINKDIVYFDYTLAIEDNKAYVTSTNPYVKYDEITGINTTPTKKQKRWGIGPSATFGYDPTRNKMSFNVGVSLTYSLINF